MMMRAFLALLLPISSSAQVFAPRSLPSNASVGAIAAPALSQGASLEDVRGAGRGLELELTALQDVPGLSLQGLERIPELAAQTAAKPLSLDAAQPAALAANREPSDEEKKWEAQTRQFWMELPIGLGFTGGLLSGIYLTPETLAVAAAVALVSGGALLFDGKRNDRDWSKALGGGLLAGSLGLVYALGIHAVVDGIAHAPVSTGSDIPPGFDTRGLEDFGF